MQLLDMERLDAIATMDGQYHAAKLVAAALNDPARIWEEHEAFRASVLAPPISLPRAALEAAALAIIQRTHTHQVKAGAN